MKPDFASSRCFDSAGTADAKCAFFFVVKIEKIFGLQQTAGERRSPCEPALLVNGKNELQWTMSDVIALHHSQCGGDAHSVVGAQGRAIRLQPVSVPYHLDRVGIEVMDRPFIFLAHHVEVAL